MRNEQSMIRDLTNGNVMSQLLRFSAPFLLANALQMAYSLVDMIIIGQFNGYCGLICCCLYQQLCLDDQRTGAGFF